MGNYLSTIDGTLVNNSAAAVHNMREADKERKEERERAYEPPTAIRARKSRVRELQH